MADKSDESATLEFVRKVIRDLPDDLDDATPQTLMSALQRISWEAKA